MKQAKKRYAVLLTLLCVFLVSCGNSAANGKSEQSVLTAIEESTQESTAEESGELPEVLPGEESGEESGEPSEVLPEETQGMVKESPTVPSVTPVENLSQLLFRREEIQKVMTVNDRRGFDDITSTANEEEMNAVLDELYAADLSLFEDIGGEACGGAVVTYKLCTSEKEVNISIYQDVSGKEQQYLKIYSQDRMPIAEIKGPEDAFDFKRLSDLYTGIKTNTDDPLYSGTASVIETGDEIKLDKSSCGYALYFFETALKNETADVPDETVLFDVQIEIGDIVYQLQSDTGYFSRQEADRIVYGKLDEQGLFMVIHEAHIVNKLN